MIRERSSETFGCEKCWPSSAEAAHASSRALIPVAELIGESHFHVMIRECSVCSQKFISIFTELIDWSEGDDPQYWTLLPITEDEAAGLTRRGDSVTEEVLNSLGRRRRSLRHDRPKGKPPRTCWAVDVLVGPHD
jgi:hypothetical protein